MTEIEKFEINYGSKTIVKKGRSLTEVIDFIYHIIDHTGEEPEQILLPNGIIIKYNRTVFDAFHEGFLSLLFDDSVECEKRLTKVTLAVCLN